MLPAEAAISGEPSAADAIAPEPEPARVSGWGGGPTTPVRVVRGDRVQRLRAALQAQREHPVGGGAIARGMARSYGDAAQLRDGLVLDTTGLRGFQFEPSKGTVRAAAGVTLGELLKGLVSAGWMVPVVPGTQHVTVGGAIASDIHGKNHGTAGTFGTHVRALALLSVER